MPHLAAPSAGLAPTGAAKPGTDLFRRSPSCFATCPIEDRREGLLHDARNLVGALGLYCDLLAMPDVLQPQHRHYAEEVRLLGSRCGALIEHLMAGEPPQLGEVGATETGQAATLTGVGRPVEGSAGETGDAAQSLSLRAVVERCAGLLSRVAGGRSIELSFGAAAAVPVRVAEEVVERILVNLVRNAAAALAGYPPSSGPGKELGAYTPAAKGANGATSVPRGTHVWIREASADGLAEVVPGTIRIGVGLLVDRVGAARPWPFRRVRLVVEDSGCGMEPEQLEWLLRGGRAPARSNHGIGFRVVRELVEASGGELRAMSALGTGTRVQVEWPMAALASLESGHGVGATTNAPDFSREYQSPVATGKPPAPARRLGDLPGLAEGQGA